MMIEYLLLFTGLAGAAIGGELFVRGMVGIAGALRIAPAVIGITLAAFATSGPELAVAVNASLAGRPTISFGDVLGSNIVNIALVLGVAMLLSARTTGYRDLKTDAAIAMAIPVLTGLLLLDGTLSRVDGAFLLGCFAAWLSASIYGAVRQRPTEKGIAGKGSGAVSCLFALAGIVMLVFSGKCIVEGATGIASDYGMDGFVAGAVIVAFGTSVPELASVVVSKIKGHPEVGFGTVIGSNIFNGLFIVAVISLIRPVHVPLLEALPSLLFGLLSLLLAVPFGGNGIVSRKRGGVLILVYATYVAVSLFLRG